MAFASRADNLVTRDTNGMLDVFVRDMWTNTTTRASVDSSGNQANGTSHRPSLRADGRYVAFESGAGDLVEGDSNGVDDVFVRDLQASTTTRVSVDSSGNQAESGAWSSSISADGRYVAFSSKSPDLVPDDTNWGSDVFVRDLQTNTTLRVSLNSNGEQGNSSRGSYYPAISADGRYVAFESSASNLVPDDTNREADIFVRDLQANITRVSAWTTRAIKQTFLRSLHPLAPMACAWHS